MPADLKQLDKLLELIEQHIDVEHVQSVDERYSHLADQILAIRPIPLHISSQIP